MTLSDVAAIFRRGWWLIALATVVGGIAGTLYGMQQHTAYASTTHGYVVVNNSGTSGGDAFNAGQAAQSRMASYAALATTPAVTAGVATALGLDFSPEQVAQHLSVSFPPGTLLLQVTANADKPQLASDLAAETLRQLQKQVEVLETPAPGIPQWARLISVNEPTTLVTTTPKAWTFIAGGIVGGLIAGIVLAYLVAVVFRRKAPEPAKPVAPNRDSTHTTTTTTTGNGRDIRGRMTEAGAGPEHPVAVGTGGDDPRHSRDDS